MEKEIDDDGDEGEDDEGDEATGYRTTPRASGLLLRLGGIGVFWSCGVLVEGVVEGDFRGLLGGFFLFTLGGSGSGADAEPAEDVELLPGDEAFGVADTFAEADIDTDAGTTDVEGFALGADGEADATFADVGFEPGQDGDAFVEAYRHKGRGVQVSGFRVQGSSFRFQGASF